MRLTSVLSLCALVAISVAAAARQNGGKKDDLAALAGPAAVERIDVFTAPGGTTVPLRLLVQADHVDQADRYFSAAKAALAGYGQLLGPFPSTTLTIVDPVTSPDLKVRRSEMTFGADATPVIVAGAHWFSPWTTAEPEMAVVQEIGRVYWLAGPPVDDEEHRFREALATFTAARVFADAFPGRFVHTRRYFQGLVTWPYSDAPRTNEVDGDLVDVALDPAAAQADTGRAHEVLALATLERVVGVETMDRILRASAARQTRMSSARTDFETIARDVSGRDLTWFFEATRRYDVAFDYAVDMPPAGAGTSAVVRRFAAGTFPVDVRVTFDDGSSRVEHWDGRDERRAFEYAPAPAIAAVEIDPDHVLRLDVHRTNNSWSAHPRGAHAARAWSLRWLVWFQHALMDYAFFA
jgi:hypothetical protein